MALLCCADDRAHGLITTTERVAGADDVDRLASAAWAEATSFVDYQELPYNSACYLEAAALLRGDDEHDPWIPGDPVYLRT